MGTNNLLQSLNLSHPDKFFIGGKWIDPQGKESIEIVSPVSEEVIATVPAAGEADVDVAVEKARAAFDDGEWPHMAPKERAAFLGRLAEELRGRQDDLALAWTAQIGAPTGYTKALTSSLINFYDYYAGAAESFDWIEELPSSHEGQHGLLVREPVGVVAAIVPWNGPFFTMTIKVAPALVAGCTVIIKPSPETPLESQIFAECVEAAGLPPGVVNVLPADRDVSDYLVRQRGVDKVSFTGSTAAGRRVGAVCADRMARVTLELGGKSAALILEDYDVVEAARVLVPTSCRNSGQVCTNLTRYLVPAGKHDEFVAALQQEMRNIKVGDPDDEDTYMGPIATKRQFERIQEYVRIAEAEGARLVTGGRRPQGLERGYYFEPTLLVNVDNQSRVAQEEIFGPVVVVIPYRDLDDAIAMANASDYGLNGAVFTHDADKAYQIARSIRTGTVGQNGSKCDFTISFGGFKQSGLGREGGMEALNHFVELKTIILERQPSVALI